MSAEITYETHILIGVKNNGVMTVIADWAHLPKQAEVLEEISKAANGYVSFALCTPTSIMAADGRAGQSGRRGWSLGSDRRR
jgi:hypothetical protein